MLTPSHSRTSPNILKWPGGKRWLVDQYEELLPKEYNRYFEPFLGGAAVFFHLRPERAVLSDTNPDLIATYSAIASNWKLVRSYLAEHQSRHCKEYYYSIRSEIPVGPYQRAARFIYLNRTCWNGLYRVNKKGEFNVPIGTKTNVILESDNFALASELLSHAELLHSDFEAIIDRSEKDDFLFVDPPYTVAHNLNGFIKYNENLFTWADQIRLKNAVTRAADRGVNVLVLNAHHESIENLYIDFGRHRTLRRPSVLSATPRHRGIVEELAIFTQP